VSAHAAADLLTCYVRAAHANLLNSVRREKALVHSGSYTSAHN